MAVCRRFTRCPYLEEAVRNIPKEAQERSAALLSSRAERPIPEEPEVGGGLFHQVTSRVACAV